MRRFLLLCLFLSVFAGSIGAQANDNCVDAICIDITGTVVDPHGNGVPDIVVWAQGAGQNRETTTSDANGHYTFHLPNQTSYQGCYLIGGKPDPYYAVGVAGNFCKDGVVNIQTAYRSIAQAPKGREYVYTDVTKPVTMDLAVQALSHTYPAPFENDPMTFTVTNHPLGASTRSVMQEANFSERTVSKVGEAWLYVWKEHITITPTGASMVHVDWGFHSVFANMMDCRMLWFGFAMTKVSPDNVLPSQIATIDGYGFGTKKGKIYIPLERGTKAGYVDPNNIVSWTPTQIQFIVPTNAWSGWFRVYNSSGLGPPCLGLSLGTPSSKLWLSVDAQKAATSAVPQTT